MTRYPLSSPQPALLRRGTEQLTTIISLSHEPATVKRRSSPGLRRGHLVGSRGKVVVSSLHRDKETKSDEARMTRGLTRKHGRVLLVRGLANSPGLGCSLGRPRSTCDVPASETSWQTEVPRKLKTTPYAAQYTAKDTDRVCLHCEKLYSPSRMRWPYACILPRRRFKTRFSPVPAHEQGLVPMSGSSAVYSCLTRKMLLLLASKVSLPSEAC